MKKSKHNGKKQAVQYVSPAKLAEAATFGANAGIDSDVTFVPIKPTNPTTSVDHHAIICLGKWTHQMTIPKGYHLPYEIGKYLRTVDTVAI